MHGRLLIHEQKDDHYCKNMIEKTRFTSATFLHDLGSELNKDLFYANQLFICMVMENDSKYIDKFHSLKQVTSNNNNNYYIEYL